MVFKDGEFFRNKWYSKMEHFFLETNGTQRWGGGEGGAVAQLVERAAPGEEVLGSISTVAARSLLVGMVSV